MGRAPACCASGPPSWAERVVARGLCPGDVLSGRGHGVGSATSGEALVIRSSSHQKNGSIGILDLEAVPNGPYRATLRKHLDPCDVGEALATCSIVERPDHP